MTRRHLQIVLGLLWLLDAALQAQPFMFTRGFANQVIVPTAAGEPALIAGPVKWAADLIAHSPPAFNGLFVAVQLLIGGGLLVRATARLALAASIAWALGVWYFAEGLGGIAGAQTTMLTGAPGAAVLYAVLAAAALPSSGRAEQRPARWLLVTWAALWTAGAGLELLSAQSGAPNAIAARASAQLAVGLGALSHRSRLPALGLGAAISAGYWVTGQTLGQLSSGQATDPNTGPLLVLMAIALWRSPWPARAPAPTAEPASTRTF